MTRVASDKPQAGEVLVAIMRDRLDFSLLRDRLWYRIPVESASKRLQNRWPPSWLAFYQTKIFGSSAYCVKYYGRVVDVRRVLRSDLFPDEPHDEKSRREYYRLSLESIRELPRPIPSRRLRRLLFIPTTWQKLISAAEINDLYDDSPLEDDLWHQLKVNHIDAERQERVNIGEKRYFLDFAVYCGSGQIDIETDGDTYHSSPEKASVDNVRDNDLRALGWSVLRFNTGQIRDSVIDYCVPKVIKTINAMGGLERGSDLPQRIIQPFPDGSYQMDMFSD